jgi:hypothetical protein
MTVYLPQLAAQSKIRLILETVEIKHRTSNVQERLSRLIEAMRMPTSVKFQFMSHLNELLEDPKWLRAIERHFTQSQFLSILQSIFWKQPQPIATDTQIALLDAELKLSEWIDSLAKQQ